MLRGTPSASRTRLSPVVLRSSTPRGTFHPLSHIRSFCLSPSSDQSSSSDQNSTLSLDASSEQDLSTPADGSRPCSDLEISFSLQTPVSRFISDSRWSAEDGCFHCSEKLSFDSGSCHGCFEKFHHTCMTPLNQSDRIEHVPVAWYCNACYHLNHVDWKTTETSQANCWGPLNGEELTDVFSNVSQISQGWCPNLFKVPFGQVGRQFIDELSRLAGLFADREDSRRWSLSALVIAPVLLLQKPTKKSKNSDHTRILERRLKMWKDGDIEALVREVKSIQKPLKYRSPSREHCTKRFVELMREGRVTEATAWLNPDRHTTGVKDCGDESVLTDLLEKHPRAKPANSSFGRNGPTEPAMEVTFENLDGQTVFNCAKSLRGSGGPSGLDASGLHRIMCSRKFKKASPGLCTALAKVARILATTQIDLRALDIFCASRLIPLAKPGGGTRPIGIGECFRRVITKAIVRIIKADIKRAAGKVQLAAGQLGGVEAAVHALSDKFGSDDCEGVLLLDASNAFNNLNRKMALKNMSFYCPNLTTFLTNIYGKPRALFVGEKTMWSAEGTTQGDPAAMDFYSIGILRLIELAETPDTTQVWYADDANNAGKLTGLLDWFNKVTSFGPSFGYYVNPTKCHLIVKPELLSYAQELFGDTGIQVTAEGARHLGASLGSSTFKESFVSAAVDKWCKELENLICIAKIHPHLAFSNFVRSFKFRWAYLQRTVPDIGDLFEPIENMIRSDLIPCLVGRQVSDLEREILGLPPGLGGLGIENPVKSSDRAYRNSRKLTKSLVDLILGCNEDITEMDQVEMNAREARAKIGKENEENHLETLKELQTRITSPKLRRCLELAGEIGASGWVTATPYPHLGFELNRLEFIDAISLRYGFEVMDLNRTCVCGKPNNADHALSCSTGGYTILRHDNIRDLMGEICTYAGLKGVETEKTLQPCPEEISFHPSANTAHDARMDVVALGLWRPMQLAHMDVRIFHANAPSHQSTPIDQLYRRNESAKKQAYGKRVKEVEGGTFSPLVMNTGGGIGTEFKKVLQTLAHKISARTMEPYAEVAAHLRTRLRFSLLRSCLIALRGNRRKIVTTSLFQTELVV